MWQYVSHKLDSDTVSGRKVVNVLIRNDDREELFNLEYQNEPDDSVILGHAESYIGRKNDYEASITQAVQEVIQDG